MSSRPRSRKKGTPSPRSRGQIQARGAGKWLVRVYLGEDPKTGKRKYSSEVVKGTKKEAEKALTRKLAEVDTGSFVEPADQTVQEFLLQWLDTEGKQTLSPRTVMDYRRSLETYIIPEVGHRRLDKLTPQEIQGIYARMAERGLSPNTIRLAHAPLRRILNRAVEWDLILRNPATRVKLPRQEHKERTTLSRDQVDRLLAASVGTPDHALWAVLLKTGVRPQEALALTWEDIEGGTLRVRRALSQVAPGRFEVSHTKTPKGRRGIPLSPDVQEALEAHRTVQMKVMLKGGSRYQRTSFVFTSTTGTALDPVKVCRRWKQQLKKLGLPVVRLYDARHTHATQLFAAGVSAKVVQERLGHSDIALTLNTYTHMLPEMGQQAVDALDRYYAASRVAV